MKQHATFFLSASILHSVFQTTVVLGGITYVHEHSDTIAFDGSGDAVPFTAHGGVVEFKADLNSASTWAFIDNFTLTLNAPLEGYDYEAAVEEINSEFTIVNRVAQEAEAKYYNLNGIEVKNPAGVAIKVVNGKAQKVLVK